MTGVEESKEFLYGHHLMFIWIKIKQFHLGYTQYWIQIFMCTLVPNPNYWNRVRNNEYPTSGRTSVSGGCSHNTSFMLQEERNYSALYQLTLQRSFKWWHHSITSVGGLPGVKQLTAFTDRFDFQLFLGRDKSTKMPCFNGDFALCH